MILINAGESSESVTFQLDPSGKHKTPSGGIRSVYVSFDKEDLRRSPAEEVVDRWELVASMLTGLTPSEVQEEGFEVRRLTEAREWQPIPTTFAR